MPNQWTKACIAAAAREADHAIYRTDYPKHIAGVAQRAFIEGAVWARRYLGRTKRREEEANSIYVRSDRLMRGELKA